MSKTPSSLVAFCVLILASSAHSFEIDKGSESEVLRQRPPDKVIECGARSSMWVTSKKAAAESARINASSCLTRKGLDANGYLIHDSDKYKFSGCETKKSTTGKTLYKCTYFGRGKARITDW